MSNLNADINGTAAFSVASCSALGLFAIAPCFMTVFGTRGGVNSSLNNRRCGLGLNLLNGFHRFLRQGRRNDLNGERRDLHGKTSLTVMAVERFSHEWHENFVNHYIRVNSLLNEKLHMNPDFLSQQVQS